MKDKSLPFLLVKTVLALSAGALLRRQLGHQEKKKPWTFGTTSCRHRHARFHATKLTELVFARHGRALAPLVQFVERNLLRCFFSPRPVEFAPQLGNGLGSRENRARHLLQAFFVFRASLKRRSKRGQGDLRTRNSTKQIVLSLDHDHFRDKIRGTDQRDEGCNWREGVCRNW